MKLHRFYVSDLELEHDFWLKDERLFHQWSRVLRFELGREIVLFNRERQEKLYRIVKFGDNATHLELITEMDSKLPKKEVYLCFSVLKKDKNDWVLQKCTELGVSHFVPIISDRTEKTGFDIERAEKIVIEASEQCERSDIPRVREPINLQTAINELKDKVDLYFAEKTEAPQILSATWRTNPKHPHAVGVLIGPEGGWTDEEKELLKQNCKKLNLSDFTLRAETACVTAAALLQ